MAYIENPYERNIMNALEKLIAITEKLKDLPDGEEKTKLLNEVKELIPAAKEEVEVSERMMRIQVEHDLNIHSDD
ncbi:hypothetical protein PP914_gp057 [Arthrobacter phage Qui]|jgi:hypothetical protein|uniref:Uncharacterized protein n=1 Tax=Arthrobacter phage Qui TaxID=2603260 RepID=A0A5B8WIF2_9CAUD|nr:hypothetical protein PP914_gp057 [Arthrobacter phage Qui]QED11547.1 hypothetical protein SEA_QUI_57 [Arthrobacter phage Qui]